MCQHWPQTRPLGFAPSPQGTEHLGRNLRLHSRLIALVREEDS